MFLLYKFKKFGNAEKTLQNKIFIFAVMVLLGTNVFCATEKNVKYDSLMKTGTAAEIKKALKKDSDMVWVKIEPENDTLLMRAIMYNRDISIVNLLLKAGVSLRRENNNGQNALMYACMYSTNTEVISRILGKITNPRSAVKELNRKDANGKSALNYAKEFENRRAIDCVSKYVGKPEGYQEGQDYVDFLESWNTIATQAEAETKTQNENSDDYEDSWETGNSAIEKSERYDALIKNGNITAIKKALKKDPEMIMAKIMPENDTLLMRAIMYNRDISVVDLLLKAGVSVKKENIYGQNALMYACMYSKSTAVITKILEKSTSPKTAVKELNKKDKNEKSALNYAKEFENRRAIDCVSKYVGKPEGYQEGQDYVEFLEDLNEKLIQAEKDAELARQREAELKRKAEQEEQEKLALAQKELEQKAETIEPEAEIPASNPIDMNKYNKVSLFDFAVQDEIPEPEEFSDENSKKIENPDKKDRNGRTALIRAAKNGDVEEINLLLKSNANVNLCDNDGWTALMNAARYQNDPEIVRILLDAGANPNQKNKYGSTALHLAAAYTETPEILRQLVEATKNPDEIFKSFIMTLTSNSAGEKNQTSKIKVFIDAKVPVNRFYEGRTPLMYAAEYSSSTEVIKFLLDNGAAKNLHSTDGKTAFDFAESNKLLKHDKIFWSLNQQ